jgi:translation initiation factor 3 subunit M
VLIRIESGFRVFLTSPPLAQSPILLIASISGGGSSGYDKMATIVNTTEEEPMLAVVRFTAELSWADAGPEVVEAEVGRLCLEAQEHVLAGRWADMASLMLASADLLLDTSRVPDKGTLPAPSLCSPRFVPSKRLLVLESSRHVLADLECILSVICNLVTKAGSEAEALQIAEQICEKLNHKPDDKPALRFKV